MARNRKKKVVRVETDAAEAEEAASDWEPTPESKSKATGFRVIAWILWVLAIGTEAFAIFFVLRQNPVNLVLLIILIFTNKNMDGKQKGIAGAIAIVLLLVAGYFGLSLNPPSVEQYTAETQTVVELTGQNLVYWTKSGEVYHLCEEASAVNLDSQDNTIYSGTVADAHADGKERLTLQVDQELEQCGYAPAGG